MLVVFLAISYKEIAFVAAFVRIPLGVGFLALALNR